MKAQKAFTLVELVIVLAVAGILLAIGIPSFRTMILNNRLTSHANEFVASMHLARSEAVKRGIDVRILATDSGDSSNEWGKGWVVWIDTDNNSTVDGTEEQLRVVEAFENATTLDSTSDTTVFTYKANGALDGSAQSLDLCDNVRTGETGRKIRIVPGGRISMDSTLTCA